MCHVIALCDNNGCVAAEGDDTCVIVMEIFM